MTNPRFVKGFSIYCLGNNENVDNNNNNGENDNVDNNDNGDNDNNGDNNDTLWTQNPFHQEIPPYHPKNQPKSP